MTDTLCVPPDFNASSCSVSKKDTNQSFYWIDSTVCLVFSLFLCLPSVITSSLVGIWRLSLVFLCQGKHGHEIKSYFKLILIITFLRLTTQPISGPITGLASKNESEWLLGSREVWSLIFVLFNSYWHFKINYSLPETRLTVWLISNWSQFVQRRKWLICFWAHLTGTHLHIINSAHILQSVFDFSPSFRVWRESGLLYFFGDGGCVSRRQPSAGENLPLSRASEKLSHWALTGWMWWPGGNRACHWLPLAGVRCLAASHCSCR